MEVLFYFLAAAGASFALAVLKAGAPVRWLLCLRANPDKPHALCALAHCPPCWGFWTGLAISYFWKSPSGNMFIDALSAVIVSLFLWVLLVKMGLTEI